MFRRWIFLQKRFGFANETSFDPEAAISPMNLKLYGTICLSLS